MKKVNDVRRKALIRNLMITVFKDFQPIIIINYLDKSKTLRGL